MSPTGLVDSTHDSTGFTGCHDDNPAITPMKRACQSPPPCFAHSRTTLALAKISTSQHPTSSLMDIYVCAARRSSILRVSFVAPRSPGRPFRGCCRSNNVVERQSASRAIRTSQLPSARAMNSRKLDRQTYNRGWTAQAGDGGSYRLYRVRRIE